MSGSNDILVVDIYDGLHNSYINCQCKVGLSELNHVISLVCMVMTLIAHFCTHSRFWQDLDVLKIFILIFMFIRDTTLIDRHTDKHLCGDQS